MDNLFQVDWRGLFVPSSSIIETILRGTLMYFVLFAFLRLFRRESGAVGITDLLVIVVIADAAQNAMSGDYKSITEGVLLVGTIIFWDYALDWLGFNIPAIQRILRPAPLPLIKNGQMLRRNMRQEMVSVEELKSLLREQGVEEITEVKTCFLEGDGRISVIKYEKDAEEQRRSRRPE